MVNERMLWFNYFMSTAFFELAWEG